MMAKARSASLYIAILLLAANLGGALRYFLFESFPSSTVPLYLWGIGSAIAAWKVATRLVKIDIDHLYIIPRLRIAIGAALRLASFLCFVAGAIADWAI